MHETLGSILRITNNPPPHQKIIGIRLGGSSLALLPCHHTDPLSTPVWLSGRASLSLCVVGESCLQVGSVAPESLFKMSMDKMSTPAPNLQCWETR
jgi:hypothetical protein